MARDIMDDFEEDRNIAHESLLAEIDDINKAYGNIITEEVLAEKTHVEIAQLISKTDFPYGSHKESVNYCNAYSYCDALIYYYEKNTEYLLAVEIDNDLSTRQILVVGKSLIFTGILALTNYLPLAIIGGALLYMYLAKKEVIKSKEQLHSKMISLKVIDDHKVNTTALEKYKENN